MWTITLPQHYPDAEGFAAHLRECGHQAVVSGEKLIVDGLVDDPGTADAVHSLYEHYLEVNGGGGDAA